MRAWEKIGRIGNDAGLMMLVDPGYVLHRDGDEFKEFGETWDDFLSGLTPNQHDGHDANLPVATVLGNKAAVVTSGDGDGLFDVFVRRSKSGRIAEVRIKFI